MDIMRGFQINQNVLRILGAHQHKTSSAKDSIDIVVEEGTFYKQVRMELTASLQIKRLDKAAKRNCTAGQE